MGISGRVLHFSNFPHFPLVSSQDGRSAPEAPGMANPEEWARKGRHLGAGEFLSLRIPNSGSLILKCWCSKGMERGHPGQPESQYWDILRLGVEQGPTPGSRILGLLWMLKQRPLGYSQNFPSKPSDGSRDEDSKPIPVFFLSLSSRVKTIPGILFHCDPNAWLGFSLAFFLLPFFFF